MTVKRRHGRPKRTNVVSVRVEGNFLSVESPIAISIIEAGLTCRRRRPRRVDRSDTDVERWGFSRRRDDRLMVPAALFQRTDRLFRSHGLNVQITNHKDLAPRWLPNVEAAWSLSSRGRAALESIHSYRHAQLPIACESQALKFAKEIVAAFGNAKLLFVVRRKQDATSIIRALEGFTPIRRLWLQGRPVAIARPTIGIATANDFLERTGPEDWDVIVLWESRIALSASVAKTVLFLAHERFIGFARSRAVTTPEEAMRIEAVLGPIVAAKDVAGDRPAVRVLTRVYDGSPGLWSGPTEGLMHKRRLWRSKERNRFIAMVAQETVQQFPTSVASDSPDQSRDMRLAIVVESPLHARHLGRLLPDWPIATADTSPTEPIGDRFIATASFAAKVGIPIDVIIRADAGTLTLDPGEYRMLRLNGHNNHPLVLIDIADEHDPRLQRRTTQYRRRGWRIDNATDSPTSEHEHEHECQSHPIRVIDWMATICGLDRNLSHPLHEWQSTEQQEAQQHRPNTNPASMPSAHCGHQASSRPR